MARAAAAWLAVWATGCAGDALDHRVATRVDSAGVTIVTNEGDDRPLQISYRKDLEIGGEPSGPASFYQVAPTSLAVSTDGRIVVLDVPNAHVSVFDAEGTPLMSFGRAGDGPGEFGYAAALAAASDGSIVVHDYRKRALQYFSREGAFLRQEPISAPFTAISVAGTRSGLVLLSRNAPRNAGGYVFRVDHVSEADTVPLASMTSAAVNVFYQTCGVAMTLPPLFTQTIVWSTNGERTVVAPDPSYSLDVFDGRDLAAVLRRGLEPEAVTPDVVARVLGDGERWTIGVGGEECVVPPDEVMEQRGYAPVVPIIESVAVEPSGALWVKRRVTGSEERRIDLFDERGEYIGTADAEAPFPVTFLPDGRFLTIEADSFDIERVVVYEATFEGG